MHRPFIVSVRFATPNAIGTHFPVDFYLPPSAPLWLPKVASYPVPIPTVHPYTDCVQVLIAPADSIYKLHYNAFCLPARHRKITSKGGLRPHTLKFLDKRGYYIHHKVSH